MHYYSLTVSLRSVALPMECCATSSMLRYSPHIPIFPKRRTLLLTYSKSPNRKHYFHPKKPNLLSFKAVSTYLENVTLNQGEALSISLAKTTEFSKIYEADATCIQRHEIWRCSTHVSQTSRNERHYYYQKYRNDLKNNNIKS